MNWLCRVGRAIWCRVGRAIWSVPPGNRDPHLKGLMMMLITMAMMTLAGTMSQCHNVTIASAPVGKNPESKGSGKAPLLPNAVSPSESL